jgi:DNA replication protein DnaC
MTLLSDEAGKLRDRISKSLEERGIKRATEEQLRAAASPPRCEPDCPECHGAGYIKIAPKAEPGHPGYGEVRVCPTYRTKLLQERVESGQVDAKFGLTALEMKMTWDLVKPKISEGIKAVQAVRPALERGHGMVMLIGTYGQAKTLVGKIVVATAIRAGKRAAYANMAQILDDIRKAFDSQEAKSTELLRRMDWWSDLDVLFIDELDKMNRTDWAQERMFQLLDRRYVRAVREEALTVVATNSPTSELDGYLTSRLQDNRLGPIVTLHGTDGRLSMPQGHKY